MGTRAAFWLGDPRDLENREWLGCIAWDGHPSNFPELALIKTEGEFRSFVNLLKDRKDFASPENGWPFPWADDVFLTDYTYAFIDGELKYTAFYFQLRGAPFDDDFESDDDPSLHGVKAPSPYNPEQPDSIMIFVPEKVRCDHEQARLPL